MNQDQTPINDSEKQPRLRAAAEDAGLWLEEHLVWPLGDALKAARKLLFHGFESATWFVRRGLVWPLQDRAEKLGTPARAIAAVGVVLVIVVGVVAVLGTSSDGGGKQASSQVAVVPSETQASATPKAAPAPKPEPTLEGAAPVFKPTAEEKKASDQQAENPAPSVPVDSNPATAKIGTQPGGTSSSATSSSSPSSSTAQSSIGVDGPAAGPEAIAVAEDFAGAFVLYETGGEESKVRKAFAATATPELAKSLLRRPPRLPANGKVPKAKVVNVVAGPSHGGVYTISVSLLRVGLTSELRLDMEKQQREWRVTNVLG